MSFVVSDPDLEGLGAMLADLVRGNIESEPARARLLHGVSGTINVRANDADAACGLEFRDGRLFVREAPFPDPRLAIETDAETLMGMSSVPLRFGMPDIGHADGRAVVQKMLRGRLKVRGMMRGLPLMVRLQKLLAVR